MNKEKDEVGFKPPAEPRGALTMVVPQSAGSLIDKFTRAFAPALAVTLNRPVNVVNRPGEQGMAGTEYVARSAPADGCTLVITSINNLASFAIFGQAGRMAPLSELTPVISFAESRLLLGSGPALPWRDFREFVAYVKSHPGQLRYGASSSSNRLTTEIMLGELGLRMTYVPFDSTTLYQQSIANGDPHMGLMPELAATGWGEKIRYVAQTGERRSTSFANLPTFAELGLQRICGVKYMVSVRAGTPDATVEVINAAVNRAVNQEHVKIELRKFLLELKMQTPAQANATLREHAQAVSRIAQQIGLR